jgi:hypothetical protein
LRGALPAARCPRGHRNWPAGGSRARAIPGGLPLPELLAVLRRRRQGYTKAAKWVLVKSAPVHSSGRRSCLASA